ncbi:helix-turn-helix transcriptional regulator [Mycobacteroides abscessus]|uniref:helix-turn-helix transcriptional regulator n=1 Tax=Mycobacteroides abscessus TaxID=36809 RepID=UPI0009CBB92D|nr:hypothetical protein [Mycobacteroides abscessus]SKO14952.1 Uncharacterised protein [Mycobacteroides abscessus subsp. bolletii]SKX37527.1 Uncharacterised protein [Mycobacteroides abscessus subsp. bolletii]
MKRYLSTSEVAAELGINLNTLNSRIQAGEFVDPDAKTGPRTQGWLPSTIQREKHSQEYDGVLVVNATACAEVLNQLRIAAEQVRTYGSRHDGDLGISATVPAELYAVAADLESVIRTLMSTELYNGAKFITDDDDPDQLQLPVQSYPVRRVFPILDDDARWVLLNRAKGLIAEQIVELKRVFNSRSRARVVQRLGETMEQIETYLDEIKAAPVFFSIDPSAVRIGVDVDGRPVEVSYNDFVGANIAAVLGHTGSGKSIVTRRLAGAWKARGVLVVVCSGKDQKWPEQYERIAVEEIADFLEAQAATLMPGEAPEVLLILDDVVDLWADLVDVHRIDVDQLTAAQCHLLITSQKDLSEWEEMAAAHGLRTTLSMQIQTRGMLKIQRYGKPGPAVWIDDETSE